jgi:hypothetical protein
MKELTKERLLAYAKDRVSPGGFLTNVLENDLSLAVGTADEQNMADIKEIVLFIYNELPSACWGSPAKVTAWFNGVPFKKELLVKFTGADFPSLGLSTEKEDAAQDANAKLAKIQKGVV